MTATLTTSSSVWIDHAGSAHKRLPEAPGRTWCGMNAGLSNCVGSPRACRACITAEASALPPLAL